VLASLLQRGVRPTAKDYIDVQWWGELPEEIDNEEREIIELLEELESAT